jgi:hypothetical protein
MAEDTFQQMDNAANEAEKDLENIPNETLLVTARWFKKWYTKAGHKRLGKILVKVASQLDK